MNNHVVRLITSIIAVPIIISFILYSSELAFSIIISLIIQLAVWEYTGLVFEKHRDLLEKGTLYLLAIFIPLAAYGGANAVILAVITSSILLTYLLFLFNITSAHIDLTKAGKVLMGLLYMPLLMSSFILLRNLHSGAIWVLFVLAIVSLGDITAYYIGRIMGKHQLHPWVSPGKTVEGTMGQIVGSLLGAVIFQTLFFTSLSLINAIIIGTLGGVLAQLGDLFESAIKRSAGAKDAGFIIPGHGGILDRLDSLSFVAPFVFYYQHFAIS